MPAACQIDSGTREESLPDGVNRAGRAAFPAAFHASESGRYTGSREPDPPPSRENFSQWLEAIVLQASLVDPRSLTVAGAAQAFHLFPV